MRRFSQRNALVTLSEINITPLLDLAFVLLIIFIIISPSIRSSDDHGMDLNLPQGGKPATAIDRRNIRVIEISPRGTYAFRRQTMALELIERELVAEFKTNPNLIIDIRCDQRGFNEDTLAVIDMCQRNEMYKFRFATEPRK